MSRITMSIEELNQMLRAEMRKHKECANASLQSVYWQEPDTTGCNWDVNMWEGSVEDAMACKEHILAIVKDFRSHYNIPQQG